MAILTVMLGGFLGTIIMTMMILFGDKMFVMPPRYNMITDGLGKKINEMTGMPINIAWIVHFGIGTVMHPLLYVYAWSGLLGINIINNIVNTILFALVFGVMMASMLGFLGAPKEWRLRMTMGVLMAHVVYGLILGLF